MASECQRVGLPLPTTVQEGGYVVTTFRRPKWLESGSNLDQRDPDPIQIDPDSDPDPDSAFRAQLLQTIRFNPLISRKVLADELCVSERKVRKALEDLKKSGVILRLGPEHGGIWRISVRQDVQAVALLKNPQKTTQKNTQKTTQKTTQKILEAIQEKPEITRLELAALIGITADGVKSAINSLKNAGAIRRVGPDKGGHWEVVFGSDGCRSRVENAENAEGAFVNKNRAFGLKARFGTIVEDM